ncbi:MAG: hypothetical protein IKD78_11590 [Bacteroidales bacterium]|nr:hypothetical protein [Bacteroidales bacterium]
MTSPIQFISKNNAVGEVYADAGMHTPAGLQAVEENNNQEQDNENENDNH